MKQLLKHSILFFIVLTFQTMSLLFGQDNNHEYSIQLRGIGSTGEFAPFWLQSKEYGRVSVHPFSTSLEAGIHKKLSNDSLSFDWGYDLSLIAGVDSHQHSQLHLQMINVKARWHILQLMIGVDEAKSSFHDYPLSMGGFLFSENARPFPRITAGIPDFTAFPLTKGYFEYKGALSHGWFIDQLPVPGIMFHHKYLHLRLGGKLPVRLQMGLDHVAQWGGDFDGDGKNTFKTRDFLNVFLGRSGGDSSNPLEEINVMGNHIISQHTKIDTRVGDYNIALYWETVSEDNPIRILQWQAKTRLDGLWGISVRNSKNSWIKGFVYEFLSTVDQSGPWHDKDGIIFGGSDQYFFNYMYQNGWTHYGRTVGTPLIISPVYDKSGNISIQMNDVQAHHIGIEGNINQLSYRVLGTYSRYFPDNQLPAHPNFSYMIEVGSLIKQWNDYSWNFRIGGDTGIFPGKTTGVMLSIKKHGTLFGR